MSRSPLICQVQFFRLSLPVDHIFDFERALLVSLGKSLSLQTWLCFLLSCSCNGVVGFEKP